MAMRKSTRRELRKLRELVHFLLAERRCCFCRQLLVETPGHYAPGNGEGPPLDDAICVHHRDGDHHNNRRANTRLAHSTCHKRFHARQRRRNGAATF